MARPSQLVLLRLAFALLLAVPHFWRLEAEEFHGDESHWISSGQQAFYLVAGGRLFDPQWRREFYLYTQPQVGKLAIGAALAAAGIAGPTPIYDYDWQRPPVENQAAGHIPPPAAIRAARLTGALAGWLGTLCLWALGAELGLAPAGVLGALLLAAHPLWLANARRAGLDAPALALGLLAAWLAVRACRRPRATLPLLLLAGVALGLAVGAKYVGLLTVPVVLVPALGALGAGRTLRQRLGLVGGGLLALLLAGATFWATNPSLYGDPIGGLRASLSFLVGQAGEMRDRSPVFASPPLVALEIVDRAVWPTGYPPVVDHTLPKPLSPGSYGTPAVALGSAAALGALAALLMGRPGTPPPVARCSAPPSGSFLAGGGPAARATGAGAPPSPAGATPLIPFLAPAAWAAAVFLFLALSVPIWWERWHLPLIPPLCLLAGAGLWRLGALASRDSPFHSSPARSLERGRGPGWAALLAAGALPAAQLAGALDMGHSYLGKGFGALLATPVGAGAHLLALAVLLGLLLVHFLTRATTPHLSWRER